MGIMVDFHTHIIPAVDDGSRDINMSIAMLKEECAQGVDTLVATPHFYAARKSVQHFFDARTSRLEEVRKTLDEMGLASEIRLMAGAEVYYFQGMGRAERLPDLRIEGTDTILVEMPFVQWTEEIYHDIRTIACDRDLKVVLAHIERYPAFQKSNDIWDKVMALPLVTQLNAGSFLKGRRKRKFCLDWIKQRPSSVLGSDCHDMTTRKPNLKAAREVIEKKAGTKILREIDRTADGLLGI